MNREELVNKFKNVGFKEGTYDYYSNQCADIAEAYATARIQGHEDSKWVSGYPDNKNYYRLRCCIDGIVVESYGYCDIYGDKKWYKVGYGNGIGVINYVTHYEIPFPIPPTVK